MPRTLLLDGDILLFKYCCVNEFSIAWDSDTESSYLDLEKAKEDFDISVPQMLKQTDCTEALVCFTGPKNFRYSVLPTYKANRKELSKPKLFLDLRDYIIQNYHSKMKDVLEADDVMGILMTKSPGKYILGSTDKDMKQIPGRHFNWSMGEIWDIGEDEADRFFYQQVLTGDPSDGYKGCPGVGIAKATKLLDSCYDDYRENANVPDWFIWKYCIVPTYESKGLTEADALQQARVARILRASDWDFKKGEVKLWSPN